MVLEVKRRELISTFTDLITSVKISNNALNFLLAQYRAIFKRAYVKGIASAVLLTAGLAAGQAQADAFSGGATSWDGASGTVTISDAQNDGVLPANRFFDNLVINGAAGSLTIGTTNNAHETAVNVKGQLTVNSGGTLTVSGGALAGAHTISYADQTNLEEHMVGDLVVNKDGKFNLSGGWVQMDQVTFNTGAIVNLSGATGQTWGNTAMVYGQNVTVAKDAQVTLTDAQLSVTTEGVMQINGQVTLNSGSFLRATDNIMSGQLNQDYVSGKIILGDGAKITATKDSTGGIVGQDIDIQKGATVTVASGSQFTIGGDYTSDAAPSAATTGASNVVLNGTITVEDGSTFKVGGTNDINGETQTTTLTIENGTLTNNDADSEIDGTIVVKETGKLNGTGTLKLTENGGITMSSEQMAEYVKTGKVDAATNAGATITFTDAVDLSDLEIFGTDKISIGANTVLAGDNVTATGAIKGVTGYVASLEDDDVKLGGNDYAGDLNLAKVIAHNTLDLQGKNDQFLIKGTELKLDRPYYQIDENDDFVLDNCGNKIENTVGRVTGDELILSSDTASGASSALVAKHGHWVVDNDIVVSGGQISADTTQTSSVTAQSDNPAYLELTGNLELIDGANYTFIVAKGTDATVDLSGVGNLTLNNTERRRITAYQGGTIVFEGSQVEDLLGANTNNSSGAKSLVFALNNGTLAVTDSLDLTFDKLKTDDSLKTANYIALKGNSTVDVAGTLTLTTGQAEQSDKSEALSIGATNTIKADTLVLENLDSAQNNGSGDYI